LNSFKNIKEKENVSKNSSSFVSCRFLQNLFFAGIEKKCKIKKNLSFCLRVAKAYQIKGREEAKKNPKKVCPGHKRNCSLTNFLKLLF